MINLADAVVSGGVALAFSAIAWAAKALIARDKDKATAHRDHAEALARENETRWADFERSKQLIEDRCEECTRKLDRIEDAFYGLLDDLEEQICPMLMLPQADSVETSRAVRACMRKARDRVRDPAAG